MELGRKNEVGTFWVNKRGGKTFSMTNSFLKFSLIREGVGSFYPAKQEERSSCHQTSKFLPSTSPY